jgi:hypothetical protein
MVRYAKSVYIPYNNPQKGGIRGSKIEPFRGVLKKGSEKKGERNGNKKGERKEKKEKEKEKGKGTKFF